MKKYHILTFGCQANVVDSEKIAGILEFCGFKKAKKPENSDLIVVNTCSVRQKSEDKVFGLGGKILEIKTKNPQLKVILAGCIVGSAIGPRKRYELGELTKKTPWVNYYLSPDRILDLPRVLKEIGLARYVDGAASEADAVKSPTFAPGEHALPNPSHAFVNISTGCDNFCSFCVVPYARGSEISRTKKEILAEVRRLIKKGYSEFTLCGQNVNSWGLSPERKFKIRAGSNDKLPFASLVRSIHKIRDAQKISFISSNPFDFTEDLIDAMKLPKVSRYLHIAVQSGNDEILKRMNRRHTRREFEGLIQKIRKSIPDIELGTDVIVGFPGETESQFMDTVDLCKKVGFSVIYASLYSPRAGTLSAKTMVDDVPLSEKKRRHTYLTREVM